MVTHYKLTLGPYPRGFHLITDQVIQAVPKWPENGILQVYILHTSAGLTINENADPTVLHDFRLYFDRLAPENLPGLQHDIEGPDDMPAHIQSTLCGSSVQLPIIDRQPVFGQWQGIYLCEFRDHARPRQLILSIIG